MHRSFQLTPQPINECDLLAQRTSSGTMGAVVYFVGVVRNTEAGAAIRGLAYEAFQAMAEHQFDLLFNEMATRWPLESVRVVHRVGEVLAGESSLWVEIIAPHRGEALAACQWLIDEMKRVVPIWKKAW